MVRHLGTLVAVLALVIPVWTAENSCTKVLHTSIKKALRSELCGDGAPGYPAGPGQCATAARKAFPGWDATSISELCRGASSAGPASCAAAFKKGTPIEAPLALCAPLGRRSLDDDVRVQGPAQCFASAPRGWSTADAVSLCDGAWSSAPAACAKEATKAQHLKALGAAGQAALCRGAKDNAPEGPVGCAKAGRHALPPDDGKGKGSRLSGPELPLVKLCQGAVSTVPAQCASAVAAKDKSADFGPFHLVGLCRAATSLGPAACASDAAFRGLSPGLRVHLCVAEKGYERGGAGAAGVASCVKTAGRVLGGQASEEQITLLCGGGGGEGPPLCVSKAPRTLGLESRLQLCQGARDTGPGECVASLQTLQV